MLCVAEEYIQIYNHMLKEGGEMASLSLDFSRFKDFLVRVAIIARKTLQSQNGGMKISKSTDFLKKRKAPREEEFWEPDLNTAGVSEQEV